MGKINSLGKNNTEILESMLVDFHETKANNIRSKVLNDDNLMSLNRTQFFRKLRRDILKLPAIGSDTIRYWTHRGWSRDEAENKRLKISMLSPMEVEFWLNRGMSKNDAEYKIKSFRKMNIEYWIERGYSENDAILKVKEFQSKQGKKGGKITKELFKTNPKLFSNKIEYWIEKGYSNKDALKKLKDRQDTSSRKSHIKRYGKEKGLKIFKKRQRKWRKSLQENFLKYGDGRSPSSKFAAICISKICENLNINIPEKEKYIYDVKNNKAYSYDFAYDKKIIEFHGDYWHCNPTKYNSDYYNYSIKMHAFEKWKYDEMKKKCAERYGYKILIIWESEYNENPNKTINKCLTFLNN